MSESSQLHRLLNLVVSENLTGILSFRTTLRNPVYGLESERGVHTFSFLFRSGDLVSARLGDYQDKMVLDLIENIASVVKARWIPMRTENIAITDASLSVDDLVERIHNSTTLTGGTTLRLVASTEEPESGESLVLLARARRIFDTVFGKEGGTILLVIVRNANPVLYPQKFVQQCIDSLAPHIGNDTANNLMIPRQM